MELGSSQIAKEDELQGKTMVQQILLDRAVPLYPLHKTIPPENTKEEASIKHYPASALYGLYTA